MIQPIKCPHCGSVEIAFVSATQKSIIARLLAGLILLVIAYLGTDLLVKMFIDPKNVDFAPLAICFLIYAVIKLIIMIRESSSHVQGICRACGEIWLLN